MTCQPNGLEILMSAFFLCLSVCLIVYMLLSVCFSHLSVCWSIRLIVYQSSYFCFDCFFCLFFNCFLSNLIVGRPVSRMSICLSGQFHLQAVSRSDQVAAREVLDAAASCMERGIVLYPDRPLFYLVIADLEEYRKNSERVKKIFERCLKKVTENPTLAYIHYMLFSRRAEGIKAAREIFKKARDDPRTTQEVYVASALMEYFTTKDKALALRIFELASKKYATNAAFLRTYVDFLALQNEPINAKIHVEKALAAESLSVPEKLIVAGKSLEFDTLYGDFDSIQVLALTAVSRQSSFFFNFFSFFLIF